MRSRLAAFTRLGVPFCLPPVFGVPLGLGIGLLLSTDKNLTVKLPSITREER